MSNQTTEALDEQIIEHLCAYFAQHYKQKELPLQFVMRGLTLEITEWLQQENFDKRMYNLDCRTVLALKALYESGATLL